MTIYFTSDTHFSHENIIRYCNRPYEGRYQMDLELIKNWNNVVGTDDIVYHLGDISYGTPSYTARVFTELNGEKHVLRGNHDRDKMWKALGDVDSVVVEPQYLELEIEDQMLVLCHYPMVTWNKAHRGSWMLHGHCHGNIDHINLNTTRLDVGVDSHSYAPVSFEAVTEIMKTRIYDEVDHHGSDANGRGY